MPFDRSPGALDRLVEQALQDPEIAKGLVDANYESGEVYKDIAAQRDSVWEVALSEIHQLDSTETKLAALTADVDRQLGTRPVANEGGLDAAPTWMQAVGGLLTLGMIAWGVTDLVRSTTKTLASLRTLAGWSTVGVAAMAIFGWYWLANVVGNRRGRAQQASLTDWEQRRAKSMAEAGMGSFTSTIDGQNEKIESLVIERIRQLVRAAINQRLQPSYNTAFEIRNPSGFSEVFDKRFTIPTPARERLEFMLKNMPGGSIGIAGSRGAGKTTLLRLFCGPKRVIETLKDKPVLGILVSAPVAYEARDFILYLFSTICQNVIAVEGGSYDFGDIPDTSAPSVSVGAPFLHTLKRLSTVSIVTGIAATVLAILLSTVMVNLPSGSPSSNASTAASVSTPSASGHTSGAPVPIESKSTAQAWIALLKIEPSEPFAAGIVLIVLGLVLAALFEPDWWPAFKRPFTILLIDLPTWYRRLLSGARTSARGKEPVPDQKPAADGSAGAAAGSKSPLQTLAERRLEEIKFQQSYTTGWSGTLKLPIGLEGGLNSAKTLAANQLSLPEVVHSLTQFLEEGARKYQVIIGIDEMDKLAGDALAQQFLNDIKSIFGLEGCFYLISVSENAMSNFERRGLPFRDAFDSSFDDFVYVDYLNFGLAQKLLEQRLIGRPIPFFALSYCMSGGLARDLIRSFRYILEVNHKHPNSNSIGFICREMVNTDLSAKTRAIRTSAQKVGAKPELNEFVQHLYVLENDISDDELLIGSARKLLQLGTRWAAARRAARDEAAKIAQQAGQRGSADPDPDAKNAEERMEQLTELAEELGSYIEFSVTMRQFFDNNIQRQAFEQPATGGSIDALGKVRQILAISPGTARKLLEQFRKANKLKEPVEA
jgi:hypothetical protein